MHVVIIGNSAAGLAAARTVRMLKNDAHITVISDETETAYARCLIPEVVAGLKDVSDIRYIPSDFYRRYAIDLLTGKKVIKLDAAEHRLTCADSSVIHYDRLLVATGSSPVQPAWPGANLAGVFTLRTVKQAVDIGRTAVSCTSAVVVGGGLISLKAAYALKKRGVPEVVVVVKSPHLLIKQLDQESAAMVEKALTGIGIKFIYGVDPVSIVEGPGMCVQAVELEDGSRLQAGLVIVGKGVRPNTELVAGAGGEIGKGIVVNDYLETSLSGVYAAGDCIEVKDLLSGNKTNSGLWTLAVEQGRYAGYNLAGRSRVYYSPLTRLNSAQFGAVPFISVGDVSGGDEVYVSKDNAYRKICIKDNRLLGFIMTGSVDRAGVYTALIKKGHPLTGLKDKLIKGTISAADIMGF